MNQEQELRFWKKLARSGYSVTDQPNGEVSVNSITNSYIFANEETAISYCKAQIGWLEEDLPEPVKEEPQVIVVERREIKTFNFKAYCTFNVGLGLQTVELGQYDSTCEEEYWQEPILDEAAKAAIAYFKEKFPEKKYDEITKEIKIKPY